MFARRALEPVEGAVGIAAERFERGDERWLTDDVGKLGSSRLIARSKYESASA